MERAPRPACQRQAADRTARHAGPDCGIPTDATFRLFRCINARVRKEDRNDELLRFIGFREERNGELPREPVFDSRLTTHANLGRINAMGIDFLTLRRRSASLPDAIAAAPRSDRKQVCPNNPLLLNASSCGTDIAVSWLIGRRLRIGLL